MTFPLILIRGLPGAGKTTLARCLFGMERVEMVSADDYFMHGVQYKFDWTQLKTAHSVCQFKAERGIKDHPVVVHNTFSTLREMKPYIAMTDNLVIIDLYGAGLTDEELFARGNHGVPLNTIQRMRARWYFQKGGLHDI